VTQIGKVCHDRCAIYVQADDCVMPREGIFVRVNEGGWIREGDTIQVLPGPHSGETIGDAAHPPAQNDPGD
jgi:MOSC domain-containing protein YiiM